MDVTANLFPNEKPGLEPVKDRSGSSGAGLPSSLEEAASLMYALSFGPLSKNDLARALKQVGMTMRDGSAVTIQKLMPCMQRLKERGQISSVATEPAACPPQVRTDILAAARSKDRLHRFAKALQQAVPGQLRRIPGSINGGESDSSRSFMRAGTSFWPWKTTTRMSSSVWPGCAARTSISLP